MKLWENINKKNLQKKKNKNSRKKPNEDEIFLKK